MSRVIESTFPSTDAWVRARDRYTADLNEDEKELYYKASLEEILYDVSAVEKLHGTRSSSRSFVQKLQPLVQAIEQYGEALDVYSNTYPLVLSSLWGSIRIALFVSKSGSFCFSSADTIHRKSLRGRPENTLRSS